MSPQDLPGNDPKDLINKIRRSLEKALKTHTDVLRHLINLDDHDLYRIIDRLGSDLGTRVKEAIESSRITLHLDDLFHEVTELIETAKVIDAIDIEVNRWESDNRASGYFAANKRALGR